MIFHHLDRYRDAGLLLIRVGVGLAFTLVHGWDKMFGGPEYWLALGEAGRHAGLTFAPVFWGFLGALAEFGGGLLLAAGLLFRPVTLILVVQMTVAAISHLATGEGDPWHAIELGIVFAGLFLVGPGRYSVDARLAGRSGVVPERPMRP